MPITDDAPQTRRRFLVAILGGAAAAMLIGAPGSADAATAGRDGRGVRTVESGGAKDARSGVRGENAVAKRCNCCCNAAFQSGIVISLPSDSRGEEQDDRLGHRPARACYALARAAMPRVARRSSSPCRT